MFQRVEPDLLPSPKAPVARPVGLHKNLGALCPGADGAQHAHAHHPTAAGADRGPSKPLPDPPGRSIGGQAHTNGSDGVKASEWRDTMLLPD